MQARLQSQSPERHRRSLGQGFSLTSGTRNGGAETAKTTLMELKGIDDYSADIVAPHFGFPLNIWSAKIFSLLLQGTKPESPRAEIPQLKKAATERWGTYSGYVFVYVLNDLKNLSQNLGFNLT